jgi:uncharacterized damage-inducible protein DinB
MDPHGTSGSSAENVFLEFSGNKLRQLTGRIESCVTKLSPDQIWARQGSNQNAVGNLLLHLAGNVRQWIVCAVGGAPDERDRDSEFADVAGISAAELLDRLRTAVEEASDVISELPPKRLPERVYVQGYDVTVLEAVYHVVEHFSQHTGQIIFATKLLTGERLDFYRHLDSAGHSERQP